ncbi:MAG TPA: DUF1598 domain-containing protein [Lacipirellula sp.]
MQTSYRRAWCGLVIFTAAIAGFAFQAWAQIGNNGALAAPAGRNSGLGNGVVGPRSGNQATPGDGAEGGAASADFDSLIDLITSTVEVESWAENGTGEGDIQPFFNGVYVDAAGALRMRDGAPRATLAAVREAGAAKPQAAGEASARAASRLRYVSLPRLEAAIADCQRRHAPLDPAMLTLAGLQRISFVLVYPETGDLVVAGPAGDWQTTPTGAIVSVDTGRPVVRLDDLLTLWRRQQTEKTGAFGCSIVPRQKALARTQDFLTATSAQPLEPGTRRKWLAGLRDNLGVQDVEYYNIDPDTRVAGLLLAADYHMKLVGMGLAEGVPGVKSYLATVRVGQGGELPPMSILRWWFAMPATEVEASPEHDAFALAQRCVEVLSENEMLAARGERVHTGESEPLNKLFADSFTREFAALVDKYPVYGELERVFELALALALVEREGLAEKTAWTPTLLLDAQRLRLPKVISPRTVETVVNHRLVGGRHIIAGISGGVWMDGGKSLRVAENSGPTGKLEIVKKHASAGDGSHPAWWWD